MSIRILLKDQIGQGRFVINDSSQLHHLLNVMKLKRNETLRVFNETDGEWKATVTNLNAAGKKSFLEIEVHSQLRFPEAKSGIRIAFSIIKPDRLKFLVEKTTEIGADSFIPVVSDRCVVRDANATKIEAYITGAVEQSERITTPKIMPICKLKDLPLIYSTEQIIFCNEVEPKRLITDLSLNNMTTDKIILIGPEGGFTNEERDLLTAYTNVHSVFLTKNILRAETAAIFAISKLL